MIRLYFQDEHREPYELTSEQILLGRSLKADVVIPGQTVSRLHACITKTSAGYILEDLGSKKGTLCNGKPLQSKVPLKNGDIISIEGYRLKFVGVSDWETEEKTLIESTPVPSNIKPILPETDSIFDEPTADEPFLSDSIEQKNADDQPDEIEAPPDDQPANQPEEQNEDRNEQVQSEVEQEDVAADERIDPEEDNQIDESSGDEPVEADADIDQPVESQSVESDISEADAEDDESGEGEPVTENQKGNLQTSIESIPPIEPKIEDDIPEGEARRDESAQIKDISSDMESEEDAAAEDEAMESPQEQPGFGDNEDKYEQTVIEKSVPGNVPKNEDLSDSPDTVIAQAVDESGDGTVIGKAAEKYKHPRFIIFQNDKQIDEFFLRRKKIIIGRGQEADLKLDSQYLSRKHLQISQTLNNDIIVTNLSKKNEIFIDGKEADQGNLKSENVLTVCDIKLIYLMPGQVIDKNEIHRLLAKGNPVPGKIRQLRKVVIALLVVIAALMVGYSMTKDKKTPQVAVQPTPNLEELSAKYGEEIQEAINARDWTKAQSLIKKHGDYIKNKADLEKLVQSEFVNRDLFIKFEDKVRKKQWEKAVLFSKDIHADSAYSLLCREIFKNQSKEEVKKALKEAKNFARMRNSRDKALVRLQYVLALDADNEEATNLQEKLLKTLPKGTSGPSGKIHKDGLPSEIQSAHDGAIAKYLSGDFDSAVNQLVKLKQKITFEKADKYGINSLLLNIGNVKKYYGHGLRAKNSGQMVEAINYWEKTFGPASRVVRGRIPVKIANIRNSIIEHYIPQANKHKANNNIIEAAKLYKRVLLFAPNNPTALAAFSAFETKALALYEQGVTILKGQGGCKKAEPNFNKAMTLSLGSSKTYQKSMKQIADCQQ